MAKDNLIPFGKYKGQPVEVLSQDKEYMDWVTAQSWVRDRYPEFYTIIVNNFREPSDTPEHNAMQVRFLDDDYCRVFLRLLPVMNFRKFAEEANKNLTESKQRLSEIIEKGIKITSSIPKFPDTAVISMKIENDKFEHGCDIFLNVFLVAKDVILQEVSNGYNQVDISLHHHVNARYVNGAWFSTTRFRIEIKPTISDDYPSVLRQMRASKSNVLLVGEYTGIGATEDQFIRTFEASGITVVFERQINLTN